MKRIFAVGDIHGCFDKLVALMDLIDIDWKNETLIFIGDYVDRGPESKDVVDYLVDLRRQQNRVVFLKGNHEQMLENYVNGDDTLSFLYNGGGSTLESYLRGGSGDDGNLIPTPHLDFFAGLQLYHETDDYIFVHGGLKPGISLAEQDEWDMLWIREDFIASSFDFGKRIIFGHTPFQEPLILSNKVGIDTGAVYGNKLTCVELPALRFISV